MPKNWQTSAAGILAILTTLLNIYNNKTANPQDIALVIGGIGLILGKDASNKER